MNRVHARMAGFARPATAFTTTPEPRTIGSFARGRQIVGGNFLFAGFLVQAPATSIWALPMPDETFEAELHGFTWLDDLAAVGDIHAIKRAQEWTHEWVGKFGKGKGPGWTPDLTGRRLIRWINHSILLLNGQERGASNAYFRSIASQTIFLSRRWKAASPGLPRFEALTGLIYAGLALSGMDRHVGTAMRALAQECEAEIDGEGGLVTRNPEELLEIAKLSFKQEEIEPSKEAMDHLEKYFKHLHSQKNKFFGNARAVRKVVEESIKNQHLRLAQMDSKMRTEAMLTELNLADVEEFTPGVDKLLEGGGQSRVGF